MLVTIWITIQIQSAKSEIRIHWIIEQIHSGLRTKLHS